MIILKDQKFKDKSGETVWFPKDGKPYFDQAFRKTFNSVQEKHQYMQSTNAISTGDSDGKVKKERQKKRR